MRILGLIAVLLLSLTLASARLLAQDEVPAGADDNGFIINLLEDKLSTESRKIRLSGVDGLLSSEATVKRITISDTEGVWLQIDNARIDWSRAALLRGRLQVNTLAAERISLPRTPASQPGALPDPEPRAFSLPDLPVSVVLDKLDIDRIVLGKPVIGVQAELNVTGSLRLEDGALDSKLRIDRLDPPGGSIKLDAAYSNETQQVKLDLQVSEPENGIFANLLGIEGRPPMQTSITADGPLDDLEAKLDFQVAGDDLLDGTVTLKGTDQGRRIGVDVTGRFQPIVPPAFQPFFSSESTLTATAYQLQEGGLKIEDLDLQTGGLRAKGALQTTPDGFPSSFDLALDLGRADGERLVLPVGSGDTSVASGTLKITYGNGTDWSGQLRLDGLDAGTVKMDQLALDMGGQALNLQQPDQRQISARVEGGATGLTADDPGLAAALGDAIDLLVDLDWTAGQPVQVHTARIEGKAMQLGYAGSIDGAVVGGDANISVPDLSVFAGLADRDLSGAIDTSATGTFNPLTRAFDLALDGSARDLHLGMARLDPLLAGETTLAGRIARDEDGIRADKFRLGNDRAEITADGIYAREDTDMSLTAALADIGLVTDSASGRATLTAKATGGVDDLNLDATLQIPRGRLRDKPISNGRLALTASGHSAADLSGHVDGSATLASTPVNLDADFALREGAQILKQLTFDAGRTHMEGAVARGADGLFSGSLSVKSPDLSEAAALALVDASGRVDASLILGRSNGTQKLGVTGDISDLRVPGVSVGRADLDLTVFDLFGIPLVNGSASARTIDIGGFGIDSLDATAERVGDAMEVTADTTLDNGTTASLSGQVKNLNPGLEVGLKTLTLDTGSGDAELTAPATLVLKQGDLSLSSLRLRMGDGSLALQGRMGETHSLDLDMSDVPLAIANGVVPDLDLAGTLSGTAQIGGTTQQPEGSFDISAEGLAAKPTRAYGLPPIDVTLNGKAQNGAVTLSGRATAGDALDLGLDGTVPVDPQAEGLDLKVELQRLSLGLLDTLAGGAGLGGTIDGTATIGGAIADPRAEFTLNGNNLSASALSGTGVSATDAKVTGSFANNTLKLDSVSLSGAGALSFNGSGTVPLSGPGLDVTAEGRVPLSLANVMLAANGAQVEGFLDISARASGSISSPDLSGQATIQDGTFVSAPLNLRLDQLRLDARFAGNSLIINDARGRFSRGGTVALEGSIGIDPAQRFPADLQLRLRNARYSDGTLLTTKMDGDLTLKGPVLGSGGTLGGEITLERTEIQIPSSFGINEGVLLDLQHISPPQDVRLTLDRAGLDKTSEGDSGPSSNLALDLLVKAPNQLFIRGRGLDAEMGGQVRIQGTVSDVVPVGQIDLIRGRLSILGQRVEFDEGSVTLIGNLDPRIRLVANTQAGDGVTVTVTVEGPASDPQITFSSSPQLPQDEVLALLIFDRNVSDLTPFQVAQLASAAASLSGAGGNGVVDNLRSSIGLANLDVTTGENGEVGVRAGTYLTENIYLDLEADSAGETKATINLDITDNVRAKASMDSVGESTVGVFFEKDY